MKRLYIAILLYGLCVTPTLQAQQSLSYWGTDFWVGFLDNWRSFDVDYYYFSAVGPRPCSVTISNPISGWSHTMSVTPGQANTYQVPSSAAVHCWQTGSCITTNKGIHVTSTDTVMLYVFNDSYTISSCDGTSVLPTSALGNKYVIQHYPVNTNIDDYFGLFNVVGVEDSTHVVIVLSDATTSGHQAGDVIRVTLNAGQVYKVKSTQYTGDFSGTLIYTSDCKPVAVFSATSAVRVPTTAVSGDHIFQQNLPIQSWGQNWVLSPNIIGIPTHYRITSYENDCIVYRDGAYLTTLQARQSYNIVPNTGAFLHTSKPAEVFLYTNSRPNSGSGTHGDASGCPLTPMEQSIRQAPFVTFPVRNRGSYISEYYVAAALPVNDTSLLLLDGSPVAGRYQFHPVSGGYAYVICSLAPTASAFHTLSTTGSGFVATTHGSGENWEAYSMNLGCNSEIIYTPPPIPDTIDTISCSSVFHFWGQTFSQEGTYPLGDSCGQLFILHLTFSETAEYQVDTALCGDRFSWHGRILTQSGNYTDTVRTLGSCDSIIHLTLQLSPTYNFLYDTNTCSDTLMWNDTPLTIGNHQLRYTSTAGCDSIVRVNVRKQPSYNIQTDTTVCGGQYMWCDSLITLSGQYVYHGTTRHGCDSIITLNLLLPPSFSDTIDTISCTGTIVWNGQEIHDSYQFHYTTIYGCDSIETIRVDQWPQYDTVYYILISDTESYQWVNGESYNRNIDTSIVLHDQHGCDSTLRLVMSVYSTNPPERDTDYEPRIWVPNIFTPDNDINQTFSVKSRYIEEMTVYIFDRMGDWVCTFDGLTENWDGTKNGYPCKGGAYVYMIRYRTKDNKEKHPDIIGTVVLLR